MWGEYRDRFGPAYGAGGETSGGGMGGLGGRGGLDASGRSAGERSASARNASFSNLASARSGTFGNASVTSRSRTPLSQSETDRLASSAGLNGPSITGDETTAASLGGSRLGQSGAIKSRTTTPLNVSPVGPLESAATSPMQQGIVSRTTSVIPPDSPTLRLTSDGLLLSAPSRSAESGVRLGDNQGGGGQDNAGQPPLLSEPPRPAPAPATPPAQPSPPQVPRQRAAALPRGPAVEQPRTLLTLSLADVTRKSLLGV